MAFLLTEFLSVSIFSVTHRINLYSELLAWFIFGVFIFDWLWRKCWEGEAFAFNEYKNIREY